ncbi:hypothetical protein CALCODRAFT_552503 [Calocera cornea HHB12733]|uniref:Something about silencing protein 4 domain-containing protein n=1 Tax=Calocera cornea HHB12733 TaxID=1353952 RepID=A0A165K5B3_9BASI|nr:hypothetical protein CALCODRAFT_552503 [Calocera cornea HHB12733]
MPTPARSSPPPDQLALPATEPRPPRPSAKALGKRRETFHGLPAEREPGEGDATTDEGKERGPPKKRVLPYRARRTGMGGLGSSTVDEQIMNYIQQRDEKPLIPENAVFVLTTREKGLPSVEEPEKSIPLLTNGAGASSSTAPKGSFKRLNEIDLVGGRLRARAEEVEDTSDAAYLARHRKYEATERRQRKREVEKLTHEHYLLKQRMNEYVLMDAAAFGGDDKKRIMLRGAEELDRKYGGLLGPRVEKSAKEALEVPDRGKEVVGDTGKGRPRGRMSEPPVHHTLPKARPKPATSYSRNSSARSTPQPQPHFQNRLAELRGSAAPPLSFYTAASSSDREPRTPSPSPASSYRPRQQNAAAGTDTDLSPSSVVRIHGRDSHGRFAPKPSPPKRTTSGRLKFRSGNSEGTQQHSLTTSQSAPNLLSRKRTRTPPPQTPVLVRAASRPSRAERNLRRPTAFGVPLGPNAEELREFEIPNWVEVDYPGASEQQQDDMEDEDGGEWLGEEATQEPEGSTGAEGWVKEEEMDLDV